MTTLKVQGQIINGNSLGKITSIVLDGVSRASLTGYANKDNIILECITNGKFVRIKPFRRDKLKIQVKGDINTLVCSNTALIYGNVEQVVSGNSISNEGKIHTIEKVGNRVTIDRNIKVLTDNMKKKQKEEKERIIQESFSGSFDDLFNNLGAREDKINTGIKPQYTNIKIENTKGSGCLELLSVDTFNIELKIEVHGNVCKLKTGNTALIKGNIKHASAGNCIETRGLIK